MTEKPDYRQEYQQITRRKSRQIRVGDVLVGGDAPITVQSMTNTETTDVEATVAQIQSLETAGVDIVRVSVPSMEAAEAFGEIRRRVNVPLISDIHFDYKIALLWPSWEWIACALIRAILVVKIVYRQWCLRRGIMTFLFVSV